jgi:MFS superfamily sulfate permease-like transporter
MFAAARSTSILQRLLPVLGWLPAHRRAWLLLDVPAGLAVWAVMVPEGMSYSGIVGVPPPPRALRRTEEMCHWQS